MTEYELFELIGLSFDPPEKASKKVTTAIEKVKKELSGALGTATQQIERDTINKKIAFLESINSVIFTKEGKLTSDYEELAKARTKQEIENLEATVYLLKQSGSRVITNGTVRIYRQKTKLSKENVENVFCSAGYTITEIDPLKAFPKFPTNSDKIHLELDALRKSKDPNPNGADLTLAKDLYAFVAYLEGEPGNASEYSSKSTAELASLLDGYAKKLATRNDNLGKLCASLATSGKSYVFNNEENRQAYEAYLKYKTPTLTQLFTSMGRVSKFDLLDPRFAEKCIKQISEIFGNYEVSLAIYNKEAGLKDEPYIPEKAVFHVKCNHCQNTVEFVDVVEAQKTNKCSHCGQTLYKKCKKCSKSVLVSLDKCPDCGFVFSSAATFAKHFSAAEQALRKSDFESARSFLLQAQSADPSEKPRTDELNKQITAKEKEYEKPINDLRRLIADKMFQKASIEVASIIGKFAGLNVSVFETQINSVLAKARAEFTGAKNFSASKQADECLIILEECVDFKPAIDFLLATPPEACKSFVAGVDGSSGCANISWTRSSERGVTYRLVRKQGTEIPKNEVDGEILTDSTKESSYRDKNLIPGQWYSYAIFAIRYGVFSASAGETVVLRADVTDVRAESINTTVRLTWNEPRNNIGITIIRMHGGTESILTSSAHSSFEDKNLQYGVSYSYKLCTNYLNLSPSKGTEIVITLLPTIDTFKITAKQLKENAYRVSWSITQKGIDLRILVNEKQVREVKSDANSCDLDLPADGFHTITVLAYSGGSWVKSENSATINTHSPCSVDRASSYFREDEIVGLQESAYNIELHLKIGGVIPSNVIGFYYAVRTSASQNRWPSVQDVGKDSDIHRIGLQAYQKSGEIIHTETARDESAYYVSLFTIYQMNGKEIVSNPKPSRFDRPLTADVFWKVTKNLLGGMKLGIEFYGNRPHTRIPELVLCACEEHQHLLSPIDSKARSLMTIPAVNLETSQKIYQNTYDIKTNISVKQLKDMKLFLFETEAVPSENFTLRWAKGFSGKV